MFLSTKEQEPGTRLEAAEIQVKPLFKSYCSVFNHFSGLHNFVETLSTDPHQDIHPSVFYAVISSVIQSQKPKAEVYHLKDPTLSHEY